MEALGAAASIAGILSLAGQSINGIVKLRAFIKDTKSASKTVDSFLTDVDSFEGSLIHIREILLRLSRNGPASVPEIGLETLKWQLEACWSDIQEWNSYAESFKGRLSKGLTSFFNQLRVAANKDGFNEFHSRIGRHQKGLAISLSTLGRSLDIQGLQHMQDLSTQLSNFEEVAAQRDVLLTETIQTTLRTQETYQTKQQVTQTVVDNVEPLKSWMESSVVNPLADQKKTLERVETSAQLNISYRQEEVSSIKALSDAVSSLGSQLAELQASILKPKETGETYSCRTLIGIEEAFVLDDCVFCGADFEKCDWRTRGTHLVLHHSFGSCDAESHPTRSAFVAHLAQYHGTTSGSTPPEFFSGKADKVRVLPRELDYISRNQDSRYPDDPYDNFGHKTTQLSFANDINSIDDEFMFLAKSVNHLALDTSVQRFSDLQSATLATLWDLDWRLNCLREQYYLQERMCLLDIFYCAESEDQVRSFDHIMSPLAKALTHRIVSFLSTVDSSESCRTLCPSVSFNEAFWMVFYLDTTGSGLGCLRQEEAILTALKSNLQGSTTLFKTKLKLYMEIYSRRVDWLCPNLIPPDLLMSPATKYAYTTVRAIFGRRNWKENFDTTLLEIETALSNTTKGPWVQAEAWQARIDNWLLQTIARSSVMRVIISHVLGQINLLKPVLLQWLLEILVAWSPAYDASFRHPKSLVSQGAVDSRDDLKSLFEQRAGPLLIACSCCPNQPAFFRSRDDLQFHANEKLRKIQRNAENSLESIQIAAETHQTRERWSCSGLLRKDNTKWVENVRRLSKAASGWQCNYCSSQWYIKDASNFYGHNHSKTVSHFRHDHRFGSCDDAVDFEELDDFLLHLRDEHLMLFLERQDPILGFCKRRAGTTQSTERTTVDIVQTTTMKMIKVEEVEIDIERREGQEQEHEHDAIIDQDILLNDSWKKNVEDLKSLVTCLGDQPDREKLNGILEKAGFLAGLLAYNE